MNSLNPTPEKSSNWKASSYLLGVIGGLIFGLVSAYFYTRAAEDDVRLTGKTQPNRVQTGDLLGLGLAALAIFRQIAELGRSPEGKKRLK